MCLILLAHRAHPNYPLIVASNRDEAYARPAAPAGFWTDHPHVFGGRDLERGGTWLGLTRTGRFAAVTNYRQGQRIDAAERTRGELTGNFLTGFEDTQSYLNCVAQRGQQYNGFSLIVGTLESLGCYSNRGSGILDITPGVHGLSNHLLNEPWPKVRRSVCALSALMGAEEPALVSGLFGLLSDRAPAPDGFLPATSVGLERERALSAAFIAAEAYGTRASTVVLVSSSGAVLFSERRYGPNGAPRGESAQRFRLETAAYSSS